MSASGKFRHRRKHSVEIEADVLQDEFSYNAATPVKEGNNHSAPDADVSSSNSLQKLDASQVEQNMREQWAATCIQTAFRGVLVPNCYLLSFSCLHAAPKCFSSLFLFEFYWY